MSIGAGGATRSRWHGDKGHAFGRRCLYECCGDLQTRDASKLQTDAHRQSGKLGGGALATAWHAHQHHELNERVPARV
jgi:hypothetical protein